MSYLTQFGLSSVPTGLDKLTGDSGGPISPVVNNIDLLGGNVLTTVGTVGTITFNLDNGTDGQLLIGGGADPAWANLTSSDGSVSYTLGANSLNLSAVGLDQNSILYVGKHGNDANDGLTINKAFLTFGAALAAAAPISSICCFDLGVYIEDLTAVSQVTIWAPNAVLVGSHTMAAESRWTFLELQVLDGTVGITHSAIGEGSAVVANRMIIFGLGIGALNTNGRLFLDIVRVTVENGFFVGSSTSDQTYCNVIEISISGTGVAFGVTSGGELHAGIDVVTDSGTGNGTLFFSTGGGTPEIDAVCSNVDIGTLSNITANTNARLTCSHIEGTAAESGAGLISVGGAQRIDNVPIGSVTPSTGIFTTLQSTSLGLGAVLSDATGLLSSSNGTDGQLLIGATGLSPDFASLTSTDSTIEYTVGANTLDLDLSADVQNTAIHGWNGALQETASVIATSDGATITFSVEQSGGGDLTAVFSDGFYAWDTTPADTVTLTAGSDTSPQINYVYLLQSTKTLTASTGDWPAAEHAPLATVLCQSAASLQTDGAYKLHAWTDHVTQTDEQGHVSDINFWIRQQNATWESGVVQTLTITPNGGSADNVIFTNASGVVLQLHSHAFPAFAGTPDMYTVNDSVTPYNIVTDLNALLTDSTGASMSAKYFSLVIWGVVSEATGDCKLMVNLPGGSYNTSSGVTLDSEKFANFTIPTAFKGTGFLIAQYNFRHQASASGTWTEIDFIDLRGLFPSSTGGAGTATGSEFIDNVFRILDDGDSTKEIAFEASGITTATTRTITMADRDIDLTPMIDTVTSDSGSAVASSGVLTAAGGTNIATTGAGSTLTVNFDGTLPVASGGTGLASTTSYAVICGGTTSTNPLQSIASVGTSGQVLTSNGAAALPTFQAGGGGGGGITWNEETGTSATMVVDNGYIANNAGLVTLTLPTTAVVGSIVRVAGSGVGGWKVAQNASEVIHFGSTDSTTGVGGSLASTVRYDAVELVCIVADTEWVVISSLGNITIV